MHRTLRVAAATGVALAAMGTPALAAPTPDPPAATAPADPGTDAPTQPPAATDPPATDPPAVDPPAPPAPRTQKPAVPRPPAPRTRNPQPAEPEPEATTERTSRAEPSATETATERPARSQAPDLTVPTPSGTPAAPPPPLPLPVPELDAKALIGPGQCEEGRGIVPIWAANGGDPIPLRLRIDQVVTELGTLDRGGRLAQTPPLPPGQHAVAILAGDRVLAEATTQAACRDGDTQTVAASPSCAGLTFTNRFPVPVTIRLGTREQLTQTVEVGAGAVVTVPGPPPESYWVAQSPAFLRAGIEQVPTDCPARPIDASLHRTSRPTMIWIALGVTGAGLGLLGLVAARDRLPFRRLRRR